MPMVHSLARFTFATLLLMSLVVIAWTQQDQEGRGAAQQPERVRSVGRIDPGPHGLRIGLSLASKRLITVRKLRAGSTVELLVRFDVAQDLTLPTVTPGTPLERQMISRGEPLTYTVKPRVGIGELQLRPTGAEITGVTINSARGQETPDLTVLAERRDGSDSTAAGMIPVPIDTRDFTPGSVGEVLVKMTLGAQNQGSTLEATLVFTMDRSLSAVPLTEQEQSVGQAALAFGLASDGEVVRRSVAFNNAAQRQRMTTDVDYLLSRRLSASTHAGKAATPLTKADRRALEDRPASIEIESLKSGAPRPAASAGQDGGAR